MQTPDGIASALAAEISPADLRAVVRSQLDTQFHAKPNDVGLQPNVETVSVGSWAYGFWASVPRDITFTLHGFHDNGLAPDTNFEITLGLRFELVWPMQFGEPAQKTLVAGFLRVTLEGNSVGNDLPIVPGKVISGVTDGINQAFSPIQITLKCPPEQFSSRTCQHWAMRKRAL